MLAQARTDDAGPATAGPASSKLFGPHIGEVPPFIPLSASVGDPLPEGPVAVSVHHGPLRELDRAYAALGGFAAEQGMVSRTHGDPGKLPGEPA